LRVAELANEAGLPRGVLNVLPGSGPDVGEPLGHHVNVNMVSFTGSTVTGKRLLGYAGDSKAKEIVLEMGGKNPCIVMDNPENLDRVAAHIANGALWNMGENCSAISRLIVHSDVKATLMDRIEAFMCEWPMGNPLDPETRLGAKVSRAYFDKVAGHLADARVGCGTAEGAFVEAIMVKLPSNDHRLGREEIIGPVLSVIEVTSFDETIAVANDTDYGLCASLLTANAKRALRGARILRAGIVTVYT
jgi:gamma-glutamyl-gamma-aminobutyraldehyde dehydrogenase